MPIYEYQCDNCNHELEELQKISAPELVKCPECDKDELVRKMSASAFHLKGGGWYKDGYSSSQSSDDKKKDQSSTTSDSSKSTSSNKSDSSKSTSSSKSDSKSSPKSNAA